MCINFTPIRKAPWVTAQFGVELPAAPYPVETYPGYTAPLVIQSHTSGRVACGLARFGLIPAWAKDDKISRHTYNARSETVAEKPCFRDAWQRAQRCIIPIESFYEPDWRSGKAVPVRIAHAEGAPLGIAGLWSSWKDDAGELLHSFAMLTVEARKHPLINELHKVTDEKRMLLVLPPEHYDEWLFAAPKDSNKLLRHWPVELAITQ